MMEAARPSETSVNFYQTTRRYNIKTAILQKLYNVARRTAEPRRVKTARNLQSNKASIAVLLMCCRSVREGGGGRGKSFLGLEAYILLTVTIDRLARTGVSGIRVHVCHFSRLRLGLHDRKENVTALNFYRSCINNDFLI
jgi:hypothetical protein